MKAVLISTQQNKKPEIIEFKDDLQLYYKLIQCDTIDIVMRKINGTYYNIICDDEGLLKENPIVSAVNNKFQPMLVGNLIIAGNTDDDGNLLGITEEQAKEIINTQIITTITFNNGLQVNKVLICEY